MVEGPEPPEGPARRAVAYVVSTPASLALVALQVAALALVAWRLGPSPGRFHEAIDVGALVRAGALERGHVRAGEWWRLLSAAFLHASWLHLGVNAVFGLGWCRAIERTLGTTRFLALWLGAALAGSAASLLVRDVVSVGSSGALFGMIGAVLALHRRALPGWRPFLASPATIQVAVWLGLWTLAAVAFDLGIDHAAHAGGLLAGAAGAWILSGPPPRRRRSAAAALALLAVCLVAAWPRPGLSRFGTRELSRTIYEALRREDRATAAAALRQAELAGVAGDDLVYYRGLLAVQENRLEDAARLLRPLGRGDGPLHAEARRVFAGVARNLGYRRYTGDGAERDPEAGLRWFQEACSVGDEPSCQTAAEITGEPGPP